MGSFFVYILETAFCLILFYLFYRLLLAKETFHRFNRIALLSILLLSLCIPLWEISGWGDPDVWENLPEQNLITTPVENAEAQPGIKYVLLSEPLQQEPIHVNEAEGAPIWLAILLVFYWCGVAFFVGRHLCVLGRLVYFLYVGRKESFQEGITLIIHERAIAPFSWMKFIVISRKDLEENGREILIHEMAHIRKRHSIDLLIADISIFLQWFNPASWLLKQELKNIHEYEADDAVLHEGVNAKQYQLLLIKKAAGTRLYSMANSFNHSKLKKRITMMLKEKSSPWARLKYLYVLPLAVLSMTAFARPEISNELEEISDVKVKDLLSLSEIGKENNSVYDDFIIPAAPDSLNDEEYVAKLKELLSVIEKRRKDAVKSTKNGAVPQLDLYIDSLTRVTMKTLQAEFGNGESRTYFTIPEVSLKVDTLSNSVLDNIGSVGVTVGNGKQIFSYYTAGPGGVHDSVLVTGYVSGGPTDSVFVAEYTSVNNEDFKRGSARGKLTRDSILTVKPSMNIRTVSRLRMLKGEEAKKAYEMSRTRINNERSAPNLPKFIMDGFEISVQKLYDMDPNRIESVTILKDAAAKALYGSAAENGVVVITTVKAESGMLALFSSLKNSYSEKDVIFYLNGKKISGMALKAKELSYDKIESIGVSVTKEGKKVFRVETDKNK